MSSSIRTEPTTHVFTREEYHRMAEAGLFDHGRVELIEGEIVDVSPQKSRHATAVRLVATTLETAFGSGFDVRSQLPLALGRKSEPDPDITVVAGSPRDYRDAHPVTALLVVEISDSSLAYDLGRKASLYARAAIQDYWVLDLVHDLLRVHRRPGSAGDACGYSDVTDFRPGDRVKPLAAPQASVAVGDLLP